MQWEKWFYRTLAPDRPLYLAPLYALLRAGSLIYALGHRLRMRAYRRGRIEVLELPCRVVSVGNLTLGGTGKTPLVIWIAQALQGQGLKPAILSRGYGGTAQQGVNVVSDGERVLLSAEQAGDEPVMLAERLKTVPVLTGADRCATGRHAIDRLGADTLILDDGYQRLDLARDANLLLFDEKKPLGNGRLFPAGILREPLTEMKRADLVVLTRCGKEPAFSVLDEIVPEETPVVRTALKLTGFVRLGTGRLSAPGFLKDKPVAAVSGIANPRDFHNTLTNAGARLVWSRAYGDHHRFTARDLEDIGQAAKTAGAECLVVTEKDSVKFDVREEAALPVYKTIVDVDILEGEDILTRTILGGRRETAPRPS